MPWWDSIDMDRFIHWRQEAFKRCPNLHLLGTLPAQNLAGHQIGLPFVLTLDDYAAFLALSDAYLESAETGAPLHYYHLGCTVLMWHFTLWDYIGQHVNSLYGQRYAKEKVSFATISLKRVVKTVPAERIRPILPSQLEQLVNELRKIWKRGQAPLKIRNIGTHRYHFANTITQELDDLISDDETNSHAERMRGLQERARQSFDALIDAQVTIKAFLQLEEVKLWRPYWFKYDPELRL